MRTDLLALGIAMRRKALGRSECMIPEVGMGTYDYNGGADPLLAGIDAGAAFIDTAESYGTESTVGDAMRKRRNQVFIATKISPCHFRRAQVFAAADRSLRNLHSDYIDLYQLHEPSSEVPLDETLGALEDLVDQGKIRFIGVSNFSVEQMERAIRALRRHRLASNQVRYSVIDRTIEGPLLDYCAKQGITVIAYSPLGRGMRFVHDCDPRLLLRELSDKYRRTPAQICLNWCLDRAFVVVIPKGNSREHVLENAGASGWRLEASDVRRLDDEIRYRRRSKVEVALREVLPPGVRGVLKRGVERLPPAWRRRFH
jgi:diketogulonate reductase-like aldo/keto reductase